LDFDLHPRHFESSKNTARWGRHVIAIRAFYNCKAIAKKKKNQRAMSIASEVGEIKTVQK
jgi:hypothetical protein